MGKIEEEMKDANISTSSTGFIDRKRRGILEPSKFWYEYMDLWQCHDESYSHMLSEEEILFIPSGV
jgi:hypothetical protein